MQLFIFDFEVFCEDWIVVAKNKETKEYHVFHNDNMGVMNFVESTKIFGGFNSKYYDDFIMKGVLLNFSPPELKELNDFIIEGDFRGFQYPRFKTEYMKFQSVDIKDDMQETMSLKSIEGHMGLDIEESAVPFDIDRKLTDEELAIVIKYCKYDVDITDRLFDVRHNYLQTKIDIAEMKGISAEEALYCTNAKLTAKFLGASRIAHNDARSYVYPANLDKNSIPSEIIKFFDKITDKSISDEDLFDSNLKIDIAGCPIVYGWGGVHGALTKYVAKSDDEIGIYNFDVASLYPSLMIIYNYVSRNIPSKEEFVNVYNTRLKAKKEKNKKLANSLKLILNTTYGAMLNQYNPLYDPLMGLSVCVSGQLFLTDLLMRYINADIPDLEIINFNTDGIMIRLPRKYIDLIYSANSQWEIDTGFILEEDKIKRVIQKDVNNYIMVKDDDEVKTKGGYLNYGIAGDGGGWSINNSATIVKKAIVNYYVHDIPIEETVNASTDILEFQYIAKAGSKYDRVFHMVDGQEVDVQKVNRVFATTDTRYGKLYKCKKSTKGIAKIESLPSYCQISNNCEISIDSIDKKYYTDSASAKALEFIRKEKKMSTRKTKTQEEKPMTEEVTPMEGQIDVTELVLPDKDYSKMNIYQKLIEARMLFLQANVKKTGLNRFHKFKYFELSDIVPPVTKIFHKVGLVFITKFTLEQAIGTLVNTDNMIQAFDITLPMKEIDCIENKEGGKVTNPIQNLGTVETYQRRYLYLSLMDIVEVDEMDATVGEKESAVAPAAEAGASKKPASQIERGEIKDKLLNGDNATALQVKSLKKVIAKLIEVDPTTAEDMQAVVEKSEGFAKTTKEEAEKLILGLGAMLEERMNK